MSGGRKCTVCENKFLRNSIDPLLAEGMTGAGIERLMAENGQPISSEIINRHKGHYRDDEKRQKGTRKRDFAILVRDKAIEQFEGGELNLADKETVSGINAGLKAQIVIDNRESAKGRQSSAELAFALLRMLAGEIAPPPLALDDGMTIEGEAYEVEDEQAD